MKRITVFLTWLATLLAGLLIGTVGFQGGQIALIFTGFAAVFSLPYLIIMVAISPLIKNFWKTQLVHFGLTILTSFVVLFLEEDFVSELFWIAYCYFGIAFIIQFIVWKTRSNKESEENEA